MMIMSNIIRQFKHLLALGELLDNGYNPATAAKELNLYPFVVQKYLKMGMLKFFPKEDITSLLDDAASTITEIRSGKMSEKIGVELLMMKYSQR
jgi:DNA polymerase-3 subunit delta